MRPNRSRKVRNLAAGAGVLTVAAAVATACTVAGPSEQRSGSSLTFDPLPSTSAAPGAGLNDGGKPPQESNTAVAPVAPAQRTMTVVVPPPGAPAVPTVPGRASAPATSAAPQAPQQAQAAPRPSAPPASPSAAPSSAAPAPVQKPVYLADGSVDCAKSKCIAFTFSGGPGPATRQFLQTLDAHSARGTFFVTGAQVALNPDVMVAIEGSGNEVGNGTWSQADLTTLSAADARSELSRTSDAIRQTTGSSPTLFRPMGGHTSASIAETGSALGMAQILWDYDTQDYNYQGNPDGLAAVIEQTKAGQIVMLHDTFLSSATALDRAMTALADQGYAFVTAGQLLRTRAAG